MGKNVANRKWHGSTFDIDAELRKFFMEMLRRYVEEGKHVSNGGKQGVRVQREKQLAQTDMEVGRKED